MLTVRGLDVDTCAAATLPPADADRPGDDAVHLPRQDRFVTHGEITDVVERLGDPVPVLTPDGRGAPAHVLLADLLETRRDVRATADAPHVVAHPDSWSAHGCALLRDELAFRGVADVQLVPSSVAVARWVSDRCPPSSGTVVVGVVTRPRGSMVTLRHTGSPEAGPTSTRRAGSRLSGESLEHGLLHLVLAGVPGADLTGPLTPETDDAVRRLRTACARAVAELATDTETSVPVVLPGVDTHVRLVRSDVEALLAPAVRGVADDVEDLLGAAGLALSQVGRVVVTGTVPGGLVAERLSAELGVPVRSEPSPGAAAAGGAALLARDELAARPAPVLPLGTGGAGEVPGSPAERVLDRPVFGRAAPAPPRPRRRERVASRLLVAAVLVSAVSLGAVQLSQRGAGPSGTSPGRGGSSAVQQGAAGSDGTAVAGPTGSAGRSPLPDASGNVLLDRTRVSASSSATSSPAPAPGTAPGATPAPGSPATAGSPGPQSPASGGGTGTTSGRSGTGSTTGGAGNGGSGSSGSGTGGTAGATGSGTAASTPPSSPVPASSPPPAPVPDPTPSSEPAADPPPVVVDPPAAAVAETA